MIRIPYINLYVNSIYDVTPQVLAQVASHPIACASWKDFPYTPAVEVKMAHTPSHLLLHYRVREKSIRARFTQPNSEVWNDSCVEFFISFDGRKTYYNFEFSCIGTPLLRYNTAPHAGPLAPLACVDNILSMSSLGSVPFEVKNGDLAWQLTVAIPYSCFFAHSVASLKGEVVHANFYKCGDELAEPHFLSMFPVSAPQPDFHCPESFGEFLFNSQMDNLHENAETPYGAADHNRRLDKLPKSTNASRVAI